MELEQIFNLVDRMNDTAKSQPPVGKKRPRGRPRKNPGDRKIQPVIGPKRARGRPRKFFVPTPVEKTVKKSVTCIRCNRRDAEGAVDPEFDEWLCRWCGSQAHLQRCECGKPTFRGLETLGGACMPCLKRDTENYKTSPEAPNFCMIFYDIDE